VDMNELDRLAKIFQEAAQKISETDARQPRVPTRRESSPRVSTNNDEEQNQGDNATRVETLRVDGQIDHGRRTTIHDTKSETHSRHRCH
jgi:hypothetical protein